MTVCTVVKPAGNEDDAWWDCDVALPEAVGAGSAERRLPETLTEHSTPNTSRRLPGRGTKATYRRCRP